MAPRVLRLLLVLLAVVSLAPARAGATIRVLLGVAPQATVMAEGSQRGAIDGGPPFSTPAPLSWPVSERGGRLVIDGRVVGTTLELTGTGAPLSYQGRRYRGSLRLTATAQGIEVINVVDVESYLRGVVPSEMSASWPMAALEAQAVAARSYALSSLRPAADYDICATNECQVYGGMDAERPRADQAVRATEGIVVTYDGRLARTYYHADSGGATASSREVWGTSVPYLVTRPDAAGPSPYDHWDVRLNAATIAATVAGFGENVGTVTGLRVLGRSGSGRVDNLEVLGSRGTATLTGVQLADVARSWGLRSTRFAVLSGLSVSGEGWGHGVGMSQYGARSLAEEGYDFTQILAYYYPHTRLVRWVYQTAGG